MGVGGGTKPDNQGKRLFATVWKWAQSTEFVFNFYQCIPYSIKVKLQLCFLTFLAKAKQNKSLPVSCSKQIQAGQASA